MQFFFCASSGLANAGAESMQAVTIVARRMAVMAVQWRGERAALATIRITEGALRR
jgi:hypothetical protein